MLYFSRCEKTRIFIDCGCPFSFRQGRNAPCLVLTGEGFAEEKKICGGQTKWR